jgi:dTMP kinase
MRGKLIVIDGADGSGKATQTTLLHERLQQEGRRVEKLDFPRYTENFFGKLIRECLDGKHGDFLSVHPKIASALYAADRFESRERIESWLDEGITVILDRYVSANMMHQGSKIQDEEELATFLSWLDEMEHGVFKVPRPDVIIYLDVPHATRRRLYENDTTRTSIDLAEQDHAHQLASERCAGKIASYSNDWRTIGCTHETGLRPREEIHEDIYSMVSGIL